MLLENRKALVTGGSRGIGEAVALELASEGANVCVTFFENEEKAIRVVETIKGMGRKALCLQGDAASFEDAKKIVRLASEELGPLDVLVNNAGVTADGVSWKMDEDKWDRVLDVNLKGCFNFTRHVAPKMKERGCGKIINVTSINGLRGKFGQSNYSASKAGIIGYTKAVARELGAFNVNVNAVSPGLIETDMLKDSPGREKIESAALSEIVLGRLGLPEDVAAVVAFLASEKARHVTGEIVRVDGGQYI